MKNFKMLMFALLAVVLMSSCSRVPAGYVGVKYYLLGGEKGVSSEELGPGRYYIGVNEELYLFPTFNQNKTWTADKNEDSPIDESFSFQSKKGLNLDASVGLEYHIPEANVPKVFQLYKKGVDEITDKVLRNAVREAFNIASSTRTAEDMYGEGKVNFLKEVDSLAKAKAAEKYIIIDDIYLIGRIGIPSSVTTALNNKIKANQLASQKENELRQAQADAAKRVATAKGIADALLIDAKAQAEANKILNASITPNLIKYQTVEKWNGTLPQVTSDGGTIISLK
jgi:regulator of protease activity HflC (stomatin/prohibitin superfamily)